MTHVAELRLKSWKPFGGEHSLVLEPRVYAVSARLGGDAGRSNYLGKTSFCEAIVFALYGRHGAAFADDWITDGEPKGEVALVLDDGTTIVRSRMRGESTKLWVTPRGGQSAMGDAAQAIIDELLVGMTEKDSLATWVVEQKRMSALATMRSSDLLKVLSEWFDLEPLDRCRQRASDQAAPLREEEEKLQTRLAVTRDALKRFVGERGVDAMHADLDTAQEEAQSAGATLTELRAESDAEVDRANVRERAERFASLVEEGKAIDADLKATDIESHRAALAEAQERCRALDEAIGEAKAMTARRRAVAQGKFDGRCPIAEIKCPAADRINAARDMAAGALKEEEIRLDTLRANRDTAGDDLADHEAVVAGWQRKRDQLTRIRKECEALLPDARAARDLPPAADLRELRRGVEQAQAVHNEAVLRVAAIEARISQADDLVEEEADLVKQLDAVRARLRTAHETSLVFDRARKRVAEDSLAEVEAEANAMLASGGIPLHVEVRWQRHGQDVAAVCPDCGRPFARSKKEKECLGCGAKRGPNIIDEVEVRMSARSLGAASDLAGGALQLSAAEFLRRRRGSSWSVFILDEATAALDASIRRTFTSMLTGMLSKTFRQGFIISHSAATLAALPGQIVVESDGRRATARVV